jgi:hypothetical protein
VYTTGGIICKDCEKKGFVITTSANTEVTVISQKCEICPYCENVYSKITLKIN